MSSIVRTLNNCIDRWIFQSFPAEGYQLALFRIFLASYYLVWTGVPQFSHRLAAFPEGIFNPPPGLMRLFQGIPSPTIVQATDIVLPLLWVMLAIGLFTRVVSILLSLTMILFFGFLYSSGKIDHNFIAWLTLLVMAFSNWGKYWSVDAALGRASAKTHAWPITLLAMILGYGWFTAGTIKIAGGWLATNASMSHAFFLRNYYRTGRSGLLSDWFIQLESPLIWEVLDWMTIIFETGFLVAVFIPVVFRGFTLMALLFHLMVLLQLNITFSHYQPLYLLFWIPLLRLDGLPAFFAARQRRIIQVAVGLVLLALGTHYALGRSPVAFLLAAVKLDQLKTLFTLLLPFVLLAAGWWWNTRRR